MRFYLDFAGRSSSRSRKLVRWLELSRYLRRLKSPGEGGVERKRHSSDSVGLVLVMVGMLLVGARRLEHLQHVCDDPMLLRFCGLRRLPSRPTIVNWLKQFTAERLEGLSELNGALVHEQIERLGLSRVTVDMDGTVVQAGNQVAWAFRGFNPHRKKSKSYYPLFDLAQTGQILKSRNRPGNVHDSRGADAFLRELIGRGRFGRSRKLEFPMLPFSTKRSSRGSAPGRVRNQLKELAHGTAGRWLLIKHSSPGISPRIVIYRKRVSASNGEELPARPYFTQPSRTNRSPSNAFGTSPGRRTLISSRCGADQKLRSAWQQLRARTQPVSQLPARHHRGNEKPPGNAPAPICCTPSATASALSTKPDVSFDRNEWSTLFEKLELALVS